MGLFDKIGNTGGERLGFSPVGWLPQVGIRLARPLIQNTIGERLTPAVIVERKARIPLDKAEQGAAAIERAKHTALDPNQLRDFGIATVASAVLDASQQEVRPDIAGQVREVAKDVGFDLRTEI